MTDKLSLGFHAVKRGHLATVVTHLEMTEMPPLRPADGAGLALEPLAPPSCADYRALFARVGAPWLWQSRLAMSDADLREVIEDTRIEIFALTLDGQREGLLELDFREGDEVELAFFGLTEALQGTQAARWMMNEALVRIFARPIKRLWIHTCTLDHPKALAFYIRTGFRPFAQEIEVMEDPRLVGTLSREMGAHIPIFQ